MYKEYDIDMNMDIFLVRMSLNIFQLLYKKQQKNIRLIIIFESLDRDDQIELKVTRTKNNDQKRTNESNAI